MQIVGVTGGDSWALRWAWQLVGARVGVSSSRDKLALVGVRVFLRGLWALEWAWQTFFG